MTDASESRSSPSIPLKVEVPSAREVRRFQLPIHSSFADLVQRLEVFFKDALPVEYSLVYTDPDGDAVVFESESEWQEAKRLHTGSLLKLTVVAKDATTTTTTTTTTTAAAASDSAASSSSSSSSGRPCWVRSSLPPFLGHLMHRVARRFGGGHRGGGCRPVGGCRRGAPPVIVASTPAPPASCRPASPPPPYPSAATTATTTTTTTPTSSSPSSSSSLPSVNEEQQVTVEMDVETDGSVSNVQVYSGPPHHGTPASDRHPPERDSGDATAPENVNNDDDGSSGDAHAASAVSSASAPYAATAATTATTNAALASFMNAPCSSPTMFLSCDEVGLAHTPTAHGPPLLVPPPPMPPADIDALDPMQQSLGDSWVMVGEAPQEEAIEEEEQGAAPSVSAPAPLAMSAPPAQPPLLSTLSSSGSDFLQHSAMSSSLSSSLSPGMPMAKFVADLTLPDRSRVPCESEFTKTWRIGNPKEASSAWPPACYLKHVGGTPLQGVTDVHIVCPAPLQPRETADFTIAGRAPHEPGEYKSYFRLHTPSGQPFGNRHWIHIIATPRNASAMSSSSPSERSSLLSSSSSSSSSSASSPSLSCAVLTSATSSTAGTTSTTSSSSSSSSADSAPSVPPLYAGAIARLQEMGIDDSPRVRQLLMETEGDVQRLIDRWFLNVGGERRRF